MKKIQIILCCILLCFLSIVFSQPRQLSVTVSQISHSISDHYLGFNGKITEFNNPWNNSTLLHQLKNSHASLLRYPGGTIANYFNIDQGKLSSASSSANNWVSTVRSDYQYTLDNLNTAYQTAGVIPFFVANMLSENVTDLVTGLRKAQTLGMPIQYIELGNEFYFQNYRSSFSTGEDYTDAANQWIDRIKSEFPHAQIGVVTNINQTLRISPRRKEWNDSVFNNISNADALIVHFYFGSGDFDTVKQVLFQPYRAWNYALELTPLLNNTSKDIWITEFNLQDKSGTIRNTWAHGLIIANTLNLFLSDTRIKHVLYHNFYANGPFSAVALSSPYAFTVPGKVMQLFATAMQNKTFATRLSIGIDSRDQNQPQLFGWQFTNTAHDQSDILVNNTSQTYRLNIKELNLPANSFFEQIYNDDLSADSVTNTQSNIRNGNILIPAYSVTRFQK